MTEIMKAFFEERTATLHRTLKTAKLAHKHPYVHRVWLDAKVQIIESAPVWCYGEQVCKIKVADELIAQRIQAKGGRK